MEKGFKGEGVANLEWPFVLVGGALRLAVGLRSFFSCVKVSTICQDDIRGAFLLFDSRFLRARTRSLRASTRFSKSEKRVPFTSVNIGTTLNMHQFHLVGRIGIRQGPENVRR